MGLLAGYAGSVLHTAYWGASVSGRIFTESLWLELREHLLCMCSSWSWASLARPRWSGSV